MTVAETLLACAAVTSKKGLPWHLQKPSLVSSIVIFATK